MRLKLRIEPIPVSSWGVSLANRLPRKDWDKLRQRVYRDANYTCQVCGNVDSQLVCHEKWSFDDKRKIQRLVGLECCCQLCSDVHHFGRSKQVYDKEYVSRLIEHWCKVNGKTKRDFAMHEAEVFELNRKRANKFYIVKVGRRVLT